LLKKMMRHRLKPVHLVVDGLPAHKTALVKDYGRIDQAPKHLAITLCAHSGGRPWSQGGFSASWTLLRKRLEKEGRIGPGLTLYGLRHTMAVILRESGCDERTIADALGQKTPAMARHYAKGADLTRKMRGVVKDLNKELARRKEQK
jgi:integrase